MQADFEVQRQQWQQRIEKSARFEELINKRDPIALAAAAGWTEADYESLGLSFYAASPEGKKDPNRARQAQGQLERRQEQSRVEKLERELAEFKGSIEQQTQQAQAQAQAQLVQARWLDSVHGAAGDDTPLARSTADKATLNQRLLDVTGRLWEESGPSDDLREMPTPSQVMRTYETQRRAELEALRPEYEALAKLAPSAPAAATPAADPAPAATPNPNPANGDASRRQRLIAGLQQARTQGN